MSKLFVDEIQPKTTGGVINAKGMVIQMPFTQYTGTTSVSITANTDTVISVLTVNITPSSTSSIIRLDTHIFHEWNHSSNPFNSVWFFYRDTTKLAHAQTGSRLSGITPSLISNTGDASSTPEAANYTYFDAPSTTRQITYKVATIAHNTCTLFINRDVTDSDSTEYERGISFISATEIGG